MGIPPHIGIFEVKLTENHKGEKQAHICFAFENGYTVYLSWGSDSFSSKGIYISNENVFFAETVDLKIWNESRGFLALADVAETIGKKLVLSIDHPILENIKTNVAVIYLMTAMTMR